MTLNVEPEIGEVLGLLQHKIRQVGRSKLEAALDWSLEHIMEGDELPNLEELLQIWWALDVQPYDFFAEAYQHKPNPPQPQPDYQDQLHQELIRLLNENLDTFSDRPSLPPVERPAMANSRMVDHLLLEERSRLALTSTQDLAAAARWMMAKLEPADRRMLVGLCERLGTFEAAIKAMPDLLEIAKTSAEVVWAMEHQRLLMFKPWRRVDDIADDVNLDAVMLLLDLEIKAGRRYDQGEMVRLREKLKAIGGDDAG